MNERSGDRDERLDRVVEELPREIEPPVDLWPGIESRLSEESREGRRKVIRFPGAWRWLAAAAVVTVVVASLAIGLRGGDVPVVQVNLPGPIETTRDWDAATVGSGDVMAALESRAGDLDPETIETIRNNLQVIDDALGEIQTALENDPSNQRLEGMWNAGVRRRGDVLRKAAVLAGSI